MALSIQSPRPACGIHPTASQSAAHWRGPCGLYPPCAFVHRRSEAMINAMTSKLRAELRIDGPILTDARSSQLKQAASLTEGKLFGTDAKSLFYSLQAGNPS